MAKDTPFSHVLRFADLPARKASRFKLTPDAAIRAKIADHIDVSALPALEFSGELRPKGRRDWSLHATLVARVVQPCVATLAPVTTALNEMVERIYLAEMPEPEGDEVQIPEDDRVEQLSDTIDMAEVMYEALILALPLYPRSASALGAEAQSAPKGAAPIEDEKIRPFAGLADLMKSTPKKNWRA